MLVKRRILPPATDPNYHDPTDVPTNIDALRLARVTLGLEKVIAELTAALP